MVDWWMGWWTDSEYRAGLSSTGTERGNTLKSFREGVNKHRGGWMPFFEGVCTSFHSSGVKTKFPKY